MAAAAMMPRGAADTQQHVGAGVGSGGGDGAGHVAVGNEADTRAGFANVLDQLAMTGPIQDADRDVGDGTAAHLGHALDVFRNGAVMSITSAASGPTAIFSM